MIAPPRLCAAVLSALTLCAGPAPAQQARDPASVELGSALSALLAANFDQAAEMLYRSFEKNSHDGRLDLSRIDETARLNMAKKRADKVAGFLAIDLDWDGQVTRAELEAAFPGDLSGFVQGYLDDAEAGDDDIISLDEMRAAALRDAPSEGTGDSFLDVLIRMDLDNDGIVTEDEVLSVLYAHAQ